jgi:hypothetical protein
MVVETEREQEGACLAFYLPPPPVMPSNFELMG